MAGDARDRPLEAVRFAGGDLRQQASGQREELLGRLVDAHTFDVPEGMVEKEIMSMARHQAARMARKTSRGQRIRFSRLPP